MYFSETANTVTEKNSDNHQPQVEASKPKSNGENVTLNGTDLVPGVASHLSSPKPMDNQGDKSVTPIPSPTKLVSESSTVSSPTKPTSEPLVPSSTKLVSETSTVSSPTKPTSEPLVPSPTKPTSNPLVSSPPKPIVEEPATSPIKPTPFSVTPVSFKPSPEPPKPLQQSSKTASPSVETSSKPVTDLAKSNSANQSPVKPVIEITSKASDHDSPMECDNEAPKVTAEVTDTPTTPSKHGRKPASETPKVPKTPKLSTQNTPQSAGRSSGRVRKTVDRLSTQIDAELHKKEVSEAIDIPEGRGTPLGEMPHLEKAIRHSSMHDVKHIHKFIFTRVGKEHEVRSNLRKFSGYAYTKDSAEYKKRFDSLKSRKGYDLKSALKTLGLMVSGSREDMAERLLSFLLEPSADFPEMSKSLGFKEAKKSHKKKKSSPSKSSTSKKDTSKDSDLSDDSDDESEEGEKSPTKKSPAKRKIELSGGEESPAKKKKPASSGDLDSLDDILSSVAGGSGGLTIKKEKKSPDDKKKKSHSGKEKKSSDSKSSKKAAVSTDSDGSKLPSDAEIRQKVKSLLTNADLESVTMKTVCQQVFDAYPNFDLTHKRELIKKTVKQVLSN